MIGWLSNLGLPAPIYELDCDLVLTLLAVQSDCIANGLLR